MGPTKIEVLVRMDFYFSIIDGNYLKGLEPYMPVSVSTKLGLVPCGTIQNNVHHPATVILFTFSVNEVTFSLKNFY